MNRGARKGDVEPNREREERGECEGKKRQRKKPKERREEARTRQKKREERVKGRNEWWRHIGLVEFFEKEIIKVGLEMRGSAIKRDVYETSAPGEKKAFTPARSEREGKRRRRERA